MKFHDITELAFQRFKTRSLRFFLTVLGVGVGIGVVFFLVSLGFGLQEIVIGRIASSESLLSLDVAASEDAENILPINNATLDVFKKIPSVQDVSPLLSVPVEITFGKLKAQSLAQGVHPSYFRYSGTVATQGKLFGEQEKNSIIVSSSVLRLFEIPTNEAVGKEFNLTFFFPKSVLTESEKSVVTTKETKVIRSATNDASVNIVSLPEPFKIVGLIEGEGNSIFLPLRAVETVDNLVYSQAKVRVISKDNIDTVRSALLQKGYSVRALTDTLAQLTSIFQVTQASLAVLGVVALFIASVGMFNTLTISLLERTREVGILKTIGATHRDIWMIFLFEAVLIGGFGGVAGVFGGFLFSRVVNAGINMMARRFGGNAVELFVAPWWFILTIFCVSLIVGFLTGLYPARRAAKLNPLDALRHE